MLSTGCGAHGGDLASAVVYQITFLMCIHEVFFFILFVCSIPLIQPLSSYVLLSGAELYMFLLDPDALGVSHLKALYLPIKQGGDRCHYLPVSGQTRDSPGSSSFEV